MSLIFIVSCSHRVGEGFDHEKIAKTFFRENKLKMPKKLHMKGLARLKTIDSHQAFSGRAQVDFVFENDQCHWDAEVRDPLGVLRGKILMTPSLLTIQEKNSDQKKTRKYDENFSGLPIEGLACWVLGILSEKSWSKFLSLQAINGDLGAYEIKGLSFDSQEQKQSGHYRAELKDWFVIDPLTGFEIPKSIYFQQVQSGQGIPEFQMRWQWAHVEVVQAENDSKNTPAER